jgi:hypothetical protein
MCHRRQKSTGETARYGMLKFSGKSMPMIFEIPALDENPTDRPF